MIQTTPHSDNAITLSTAPVLQVNQIVQRHRVHGTIIYFVVYDIEQTHSGYIYKLINVKNKKFDSTRNPIPLSQQQYQGGTFYNDETPEFMMASLVTELYKEASEIVYQAKAEKERVKELEKIGTQHLNEIIPPDAKGAILAVLYKKDHTSHSDDAPRKRLRVVFLGFSTFRRKSIPELRKMAAHFSETALLSQDNPNYLQNNYTLGEKYEDGWNVYKEEFYPGHSFISRFAEYAADPDNIHLPPTKKQP